MIRKHADPRPFTSAIEKAGWNAEKQMAHYLDRAFKDREDVHVFHDLRIEEKGEVAQIDHLVLEPFGFHIIESKSVTSSVRVNARDEWMREWDGVWTGMPSPLLQAERQSEFLRKFMDDHAQHLVKMLLPVLKFHYGRLRWFTWVAISDQGIILQELNPPHLTVLKADQIIGSIRSTMHDCEESGKVQNFMKGYDPSSKFHPELITRISLWILNHHRPKDSVQPVPKVDPLEFHEPDPYEVKHADDRPESKICRFCESRNLEIRSGPHSLYFKCLNCGKNTPILFHCRTPKCKPRLESREGGFFIRICEACGTERPYFRNPAPKAAQNS